MSSGTLTPPRDTRGRWVALSFLFLLGLPFFAGGLYDQQARVRAGAPWVALSLLSLSRFLWLFAQIIVHRQWHVYRLRRYEGPVAIRRFVYGKKGLAVFLALLALWTIGLWLMAISR